MSKLSKWDYIPREKALDLIRKLAMEEITGIAFDDKSFSGSDGDGAVALAKMNQIFGIVSLLASIEFDISVEEPAEQCAPDVDSFTRETGEEALAESRDGIQFPEDDSALAGAKEVWGAEE